MWSQIIVSLGISIFTWLMMYCDSRLFDRPKSKSVYFKNIILVNIVVFGTIFMMKYLVPGTSPEQLLQSGGNKIGGASAYIKDIGESVLTGAAPF